MIGLPFRAEQHQKWASWTKERGLTGPNTEFEGGRGLMAWSHAQERLSAARRDEDLVACMGRGVDDEASGSHALGTGVGGEKN